MNHTKISVRLAAIALITALFSAVLCSCTSQGSSSQEQDIEKTPSSAPATSSVEQTEFQPTSTPSAPPVEPTINPALTDPFNPPEDLSMCDEIDLWDGSGSENKSWLEGHEGQWVKVVGVEIDLDKSNDDVYAYYAPNQPWSGSFQIAADMSSFIILSDGLSDTAYMFLANVGGSIAGNNAFVDDAENITSDPTGSNEDVPGFYVSEPILYFSADSITANEPRFLSNYEGQYITVSEIDVYTIFDDHIGGNVNVYFSDQSDLFAVNEQNVITVSGYVTRSEYWDDVIITNAVLVSIDKESMWDW